MATYILESRIQVEARDEEAAQAIADELSEHITHPANIGIPSGVTACYVDLVRPIEED